MFARTGGVRIPGSLKMKGEVSSAFRKRGELGAFIKGRAGVRGKRGKWGKGGG